MNNQVKSSGREGGPGRALGAATWLEALGPAKCFRAVSFNGFVCRVLRNPLGVVLTLLIIICEGFVPKIMNYSTVLVCAWVIALVPWKQANPQRWVCSHGYKYNLWLWSQVYCAENHCHLCHGGWVGIFNVEREPACLVTECQCSVKYEQQLRIWEMWVGQLIRPGLGRDGVRDLGGSHSSSTSFRFCWASVHLPLQASGSARTVFLWF